MTSERIDGGQRKPVVPVSTNESWHAWRICEKAAEQGGSTETWKYAFAVRPDQSVSDLYIRLTDVGFSPARKCCQWQGAFSIASGRHVDVLPWPAASAIVVAAANALYIVDPDTPEQFSGFAAPVEINAFTFDESAQHLFIADSLRIYAFSSDRVFRWISEPLNGYGARFRGCRQRMLTVEVKKSKPGLDCEELTPSLIRLRIEDGTILRSRFRIVQNYLSRAE